MVRRVVAVLLGGLVVAVLGVLGASPASAHAELERTTPSNGARLAAPPEAVRLEFSEGVHLVDGGLQLLDDEGTPVPSSDAEVADGTVTWPMPSDLPDGRYVASWRVVSVDGHPVSGAFSFGVGVAAAPLPGGSPAAQDDEVSTAPLPVLAARWAGYVGFSLLVGALVLAGWCSPALIGDPRLRRLVGAGLAATAAAAVLSALLQGPYAAGASFARLLSPTLLRQTLAEPVGTALLWRLALVALLAGLLGMRGSPVTRALAAAVLVGLAATYAAAGHGVASGRLLDTAAVTVHVAAAGLWVGGLVVLLVLRGAVEPRAVARFSGLAMASVLVLAATGAWNSWVHLTSPDDLLLTRYGQLLLLKVVLVAAALAAAAVSRRSVRARRSPLDTVRIEVAVVVPVLLVTAALSMTTPPSRVADSPATSAGAVTPTTDNAVLRLPLSRERAVILSVAPATTAGSRVRIGVTGPGDVPLEARRVTLRVSDPGRDVGAIAVPLTRRGSLWRGAYTFPWPGSWTATVTVTFSAAEAVVSAGTVEVSR